MGWVYKQMDGWEGKDEEEEEEVVVVVVRRIYILGEATE